MNDNIQKEVITLPPFKRFCMTIGELPSSYVETMTYYEMVLWFTKYLSDTIIPTVNNNAEAVTELQNLFVELQSYVNNYFDNLDVQEEINNKLDDMAESGELETIIINYFKKLNVSYEQFGAIGDGITDDYQAIKDAHDYANANNINIVCQANKTYYLKNVPETILIKTSVDWNNSKFIIDDSENPTNNIPIFEAIPNNPILNISSAITELSKNQKSCNITGYGNALIHVENASKKDYIRKGTNQDSGQNRTDIFRITDNGTIIDDIIWDFTAITKIMLYPIDDYFITIKNGFFETIVNSNPNSIYYNRNIMINRSKVIIENITHTITGENDTNYASPYDGFIKTYFASQITIKNCNLSGHKTYIKDGVSQGSYDIYNYASIDVTLDHVNQVNSITNTSLWGIHASNYSKDLKLYDCIISRFDAHRGVHNFEIKNCKLGRQGIRFVGSGLGIIENTSVDGSLAFVELREDYGATFDGKLIIKNCKLISNMAQGDFRYLIRCNNEENWDFGYKCYVPEIDVENFESYVYSSCSGVCIFGFKSHTSQVDFDEDYETNVSNNVYPYIFTKKAKLKNCKIMNNENCCYIFIRYVEPMTLYMEDTGKAQNKLNNVELKNPLVKTNGDYEIDDVKINVTSKLNETGYTRCCLWNVYGINMTNINLTDTHRPVINIKLKNCDKVTLGISGRPINLDIENCKLYLINFRDTSGSFNHGYTKINNSDFIFYFSGEITYNNRLFDNVQNGYEVTNSNFVFSSNILSDISNNNFPLAPYTDTNGVLYNFNRIFNCNYIGVTDDNIKALQSYIDYNRRYGLSLTEFKNHDKFIRNKICGYDNQIPQSNNLYTIPEGTLFYDLTNNKLKVFNGTNFIDV